MSAASGEDSTPVYETLSEEEILAQYYDYWSKQMMTRCGVDFFKERFSAKDCIDDWVVIHWAVESTDLVYRLRKRASIRRQIPSRKSVLEGQPDRIADLLEEAACFIDRQPTPVPKNIELINALRCYADDMHSAWGYNGYSTVMSKAADALAKI